MRRSRKPRESDEDLSIAADEANGETAPYDDPSDGQAEHIEARLAPIEEFRSKSDSWMKETSAQLARISTHVQQDEKRQGKLDDRLAEFEDRLQAMLQLTEALGMDQSPFVAGRDAGHAPPGASAGPAATKPEPPAGRSVRAPPRSPDDDENVLVIPADGEGYVGRPAPRAHAHPNDATAEQAPADATAEQAPADASGPDAARTAESQQDFDDVSDNPFFTGPSKLVPADAEPAASRGTTEPVAPDRSPHAVALAAPGPTAPAQPPETGPSAEHTGKASDAPGALAESFQLHPAAARDAERRLAFLQVAGLLARHLRPMDIDPFLECYAHTGWIDPPDITKVRTLASDLSRNRREPVQRIDREELHVRTILLMSRIAAGFERRAPRELDRLAQDRQRIARSDWMADDP